VQLLERAFPADPASPAAWSPCKRLVLHAAAVAEASPTDPPTALVAVSLLTRVAAYRDIVGDVDRADSTLEAGLKLSREANLKEGREVAWLQTEVAVARLLRSDTGYEELVLSAVGSSDDPWIRSATAGMLALLEWQRGQSERALERVFVVARSTTQTVALASINTARGLVLLELGQLDDAEDALDRAVKALASTDDPQRGDLARAETARARLAAARGDAEELDLAVEHAAHVIERGDLPASYAGPLIVRLAQLRRRLSSSAESERELRRAERMLGSHPKAKVASLALACRRLARQDVRAAQAGLRSSMWAFPRRDIRTKLETSSKLLEELATGGDVEDETAALVLRSIEDVAEECLRLVEAHDLATAALWPAPTHTHR
jgi:tetratricopeptide (TPR) repeat protein